MAKKKLTERDLEVMEFIDIYKLATTRQIADIHFSCLRYAQERLTELYERGTVKRWQPRVGEDYIYYCGRRPNRVVHALLGTEFAIQLVRMGIEIIQVKKELVMGDVKGHWIKVDYLFRVRLNDKTFNLAVEVENTKQYDTWKYDELLRKGNYSPLKNCPLPIVITDKKVPPSKLFEPIIIKTNFSNMEDLISKLLQF